jgi:hypothetical protein
MRLTFQKSTHSTIGHPAALVACYVASWRLPRLDSHQLAVDSFRTHQAMLGSVICIFQYFLEVLSLIASETFGKTNDRIKRKLAEQDTPSLY